MKDILDRIDAHLNEGITLDTFNSMKPAEQKKVIAGLNKRIKATKGDNDLSDEELKIMHTQF